MHNTHNRFIIVLWKCKSHKCHKSVNPVLSSQNLAEMIVSFPDALPEHFWMMCDDANAINLFPVCLVYWWWRWGEKSASTVTKETNNGMFVTQEFKSFNQSTSKEKRITSVLFIPYSDIQNKEDSAQCTVWIWNKGTKRYCCDCFIIKWNYIINHYFWKWFRILLILSLCVALQESTTSSSEALPQVCMHALIIHS